MEKLINTVEIEALNTFYRFYIYHDGNSKPKYKLYKLDNGNEIRVQNIYAELIKLNENLKK